ncbi:hypothetical protein F5Y07DRAFT_347621 [Xylaria sp. FL0933]|nr:hypothetical protein F5Y07DRAFT_347621 [Xylaria sp. FL0933]
MVAVAVIGNLMHSAAVGTPWPPFGLLYGSPVSSPRPLNMEMKDMGTQYMAGYTPASTPDSLTVFPARWAVSRGNRTGWVTCCTWGRTSGFVYSLQGDEACGRRSKVGKVTCRILVPKTGSAWALPANWILSQEDMASQMAQHIPAHMFGTVYHHQAHRLGMTAYYLLLLRTVGLVLVVKLCSSVLAALDLAL